MKSRQLTGMRERMAAALGLELTDGQWGRILALDSYSAFQAGQGSFNEWVRDAILLLADFGIKVADSSASAEEPGGWNPDLEASRNLIDGVKARLVAGHLDESHGGAIKNIRSTFDGKSVDEVLTMLDAWSAMDLLALGRKEHDSRLVDLVSKWFTEKSNLIDLYLSGDNHGKTIGGLFMITRPDTDDLHFVAFSDLKSGLGQLQGLAKSLGTLYGWSEPDSAAYVVFGRTPPCPSHAIRWRENHDLPGLSRIVLEIDPTLTPDEVREIYRSERRKHTKYPLRISHKHLLAALYAFSPDSLGLSWADRHRRHSEIAGKLHKGLIYKDAKFFRRDAEKARQKLLMPRFGIDGD